MRIKPIASNMTELHLASGIVVLFSYETPVAALIPGVGYIRTAQRWSQTTSRHITKWLDGISAREVPQAELSELTERAA